MTERPLPTPNRRVAYGGWAVALLVSAGATWSMAQSPPVPSADPLPQPLPRPPSAEEQAAVEALGSDLAQAIVAASRRRGSFLPISEYEAVDSEGTRWLPEGLPDNPLTPAIAWVWEGCAPQPTPVPPPDWVVCVKTATLRAGGLAESPTWSLSPEATEPSIHQGSGNP